jgi:hypothetical protein
MALLQPPKAKQDPEIEQKFSAATKAFAKILYFSTIIFFVIVNDPA